MNHGVSGRKLRRPSDHRNAMLRNLVTYLILNGRIVTTEARAKELRKVAERMVTLGKKGNIASIRQAKRVVNSKIALGKLFGELATKFGERKGGYTRFMRYKNRKGDGAPVVIMEWVD